MKTHFLLLSLLLIVFSSSFAQRISFAPGDSSVQYKSEYSPELRNAPFQFSILTPPLSTNGLDFYKTVNDVSVNTFLGISAGTNMVEAAGFANVNLYYTQGVQAAGFANVTGLLNSDYQSEGAQAAGFANLSGSSYKGIQASGFANISTEFSGLQASGFLNATLKASDAFQASGFANVAIEGDGVFQASGFGNAVLEGRTRSQFAGFANLADEVEGIQAAGFINIARKVKGVQLAGFINICDSIDGVAIAFINLVKSNGYRSFEFSFNEWSPFQFTYKMGTKNFYNIYSISKMPLDWDKYALGFGFGHAIEMGNHAELDLEVINHNLISVANFGYWNEDYSNNNNLLQFKPVFKRKVGNNVALNFGPTLNFNYGYARHRGQDYQNHGIQPFWKLLNGNESSSRLWVGFSAGISIN